MKLIFVTLLAVIGVSYGAGPEANARTISAGSDGPNPDGSYQWNYQTDNGISAQEQGQPKGPEILAAQGSFQFKTPEGQDVGISYIADENGFQPQGDAIPPIPAAILRSLEWNAAHPEQDVPQKQPRY